MKSKNKPVTISDVARYVGVSTSTVSRVITGNIKVDPAKEAAILEAMNVLGYRPNKFAQGLANGSSMMIGVLTQHIASLYYGELVSGIEQGLHESPYLPMIIPGNWLIDDQRRAINLFIQHRVDAVIILGGQLPDEELVTLSEEIPLIVVGRKIPALKDYCLNVDNVKGAYSATRHLIELGHRSIAHVTGIMDQQDAMDRYEGYRQALVDAKIKLDKRLIVEGNFREQSGMMAVETLFTRGVAFTAIFSGNDQMADGVQLGLYRRGIRIPDDVSLVGYDDQPGMMYNRPPLTTVRQPAFEMGVMAAQGVLALLNNKLPDFPELVGTLIVRESTSSPYHPSTSASFLTENLRK